MCNVQLFDIFIIFALTVLIWGENVHSVVCYTIFSFTILDEFFLKIHLFLIYSLFAAQHIVLLQNLKSRLHILLPLDGASQ